MQPSNISERFLLLQKIRYTSVAMSRIAGYADFNTPGCSVIIPVLPHPPNILPELEATGAPASIISRELLTFKERCLVLRQQAEISMHKIARMPSLPSSERSSDLLSSRSILVLRETYLAQVEGLRASTVNRLSHCSTRKRAIFNVGVCSTRSFLLSSLSQLRSSSPYSKSILMIIHSPRRWIATSWQGKLQ